MSWLDKVVNLAVQSAGSLIGTRPTVNFTGASVTVTDDSANNRVNVAIASSSAPDATTTTKGIVQLAGDIAGTATSVQVAKVNGVSVSGTPTAGQVITASNGTTAAWATPAAPSDASTSAKGIVQLAGDIAGTSTSVTVAKVNGVSVSGTPTAGQVITASSGTAAAWATPSGGAGPHAAIDANHQLVYYCDEASGTTFTNLGSIGSGANLTLAGTYIMADKGLFSHGTNAVMWTATSATDGASVSGQSISLGANFTAEIVLDWVNMPGNFGGVAFEIGDNTRQNGVFFSMTGPGGLANPNNVQSLIFLGGVFSQLIQFTAPNIGSRVYLAGVKSGGTYSLYANGALLGSISVNSSAVGTMTKVAIGNNTAANQPFRGRVAEVRLSDVARNQAYISSMAASISGL